MTCQQKQMAHHTPCHRTESQIHVSLTLFLKFPPGANLAEMLVMAPSASLLMASTTHVFHFMSTTWREAAHTCAQ